MSPEVRATVVTLVESGVSIDEVISVYGDIIGDDQAYVDALPYSDELEAAGTGVGMASAGADPGAWVLAWVWVTNHAAGVEAARDDEDANA